MTDLHTHILPGMDDGAKTTEESLWLLNELKKQGVNKVALTPHFYPRKETPSEFLARRQIAWNSLQEAVKDTECPELFLGAEVAWVPNMPQWPDLEKLCYQNTKILLVELPVMPWTDNIYRELDNLEGRRGVIPMIAHIDRYFYLQKRKDIDRLLGMGYPVQVSAEALFSFGFRKQALQLLQNYDGLLISDCHNMSRRAPNLAQAIKMMEKKLGKQMTQKALAMTDDILAD